jgi:hypothetical protein
MIRQYRYVGPAEIADRVVGGRGGIAVDSIEKLETVLHSMNSPHNGANLTVTFVIDLFCVLRVADRRSEHVICAEGRSVLSAGEMTFACDGKPIIVERVTNQSTGYCPEPESWTVVAAALDRLPLVHPDWFDPACVFRKCPSCSQTNIIKDEWYVCEVCQSPLPKQWNFE